MIKRLLFFTFIFFIAGIFQVSAKRVPGSDTCWTRRGDVGLNLTQASFSNWSAGGENTIGFVVNLNYSADMKKGKHLWQNRFETSYGFNKTESDGHKKTSDKIYLSSNYGYNVGKAWYISAMANVQTQYTDGFNYSMKPKDRISAFLAPAHVTAGLGAKWNPKPFFTATLSAASWRGVIVREEELRESYGIDIDKNIRNEFGGDLTFEYNQYVMKNINLFSRLQFFSDYLNNPENVDLSWDVKILLTVNKWFSASITTSMLYDDDTKTKVTDAAGNTSLAGPKLQFKEMLGIGFSFAF